MAETDKVNLLDLDRAALEGFFADHGEKPFRATQLMKWLYHQGVTEFAAMTNISKALRVWLAEHAEVRLPRVVSDQLSADGTRKWVFGLDDGSGVETVFIPDGQRGTLCISSQVGCPIECSFCATGRQGFNRNLKTGEIVAQFWLARRMIEEADGDGPGITNVVMMGMGEPLLNFNAVVRATNLMKDDLAFGLSKRRVTLSTAGVVPAMDRLAAVTDISLAVSLHAADDELRSELVPLNRKYPVREVVAAAARYIGRERYRVVTFEYVMLDGINDRPEHAHALAKLLHGVPAKVNLIPYNPVEGIHYARSSDQAINTFRFILIRAGLTTMTRKTRGDDIDAACGQLVGQVQNRRHRKSPAVTVTVA